MQGRGTLRGIVRFAGTAPQMKPITVSAEACCKTIPPLAEETAIVNPNGTLRNVFVYLEGAPQTDGTSLPAALLDQEHCRYTPHVLAVQVGQPLRIRSSDPTMHNVHFNPQYNQACNFAMTSPGAEVRTTFDAPEMIRMKCDVHPWMTAWVGVFDNPYYAVTQEDGSFVIDKVPAGTYRLVAWHELYGQQDRTVTVADDQPIDAEFVFGKS
jgi:plastocyanin